MMHKPAGREICILYEDQHPQIPQGQPILERIHFLPARKLKEGILQEDSDCKVVFAPLHQSPGPVLEELRNIFPNAEFFSYAPPDCADLEALSARIGFSSHIYLPFSSSLLTFLLSRNSSLLTSLEKKLALQDSEGQHLLSVFSEVLNVLSLGDSLDYVYREFSMLACRFLEAENFLIYLFKEDRQQLDLAHAVKALFEENRLLDFSEGNALLEDLYRRGTPFFQNGFDENSDLYQSWTSYQVRNFLAMPFRSPSRAGGLFLAVNKKDAHGFSEIDSRYLQIMSHPFLLLHQNLLEHEQVRKLTITDDLTGLFNFRYLRQFLGVEIKRTLRYEKNLSLLFIDIDNFKGVNDTYGHLVGSATLCEVGQLMKRLVRDSDVVLRYGGDEFVIILPETHLDGAKVIAERLRKRTEEYLFKGGRDLTLRLTLSIGISTCPLHSTTAEGLLQKADGAMYVAKEESKNQVRVAS